MEKTKIAIISTDGVNVNEHFGRAECFLIYDVGGPMTLLEKRATEALSVGDPDHRFDAERFDRISALLQDCCQVYMTQIGEVPAAKLRDLGIEPVVYDGAIADIAG